MRLFSKSKDGGPNSTVTGWWLIEIKSLFSIVLLKFDKGSRENYHNHAFNALTWWLKGNVIEFLLDGSLKHWAPSFLPKFTSRKCFHKIYAIKTSYALSFRGPWNNTWEEYKPNEREFITLTHGRKEVNNE